MASGMLIENCEGGEIAAGIDKTSSFVYEAYREKAAKIVAELETLPSV